MQMRSNVVSRDETDCVSNRQSLVSAPVRVNPTNGTPNESVVLPINGSTIAYEAAMSMNAELTVDQRLVRSAGRSAALWNRNSKLGAPLQLFDLPIANVSLQYAVHDLVSRARKNLRTRVAFINAHVVNTAASDPAYARVLASADRNYADGSGMALAARLLGAGLVDNVNGTDMFPLLCAAAAEAGQKIFLLGGKPGVAEAAAQTVRAMGYGSAIAGAHHGYILRGEEEGRRAIDAVNASGASILLVGMGVPMQDIWIAKNFPRLETPVVAGVGGLFDFFAGNVSRAPTFLRKSGLEWTWRLAQEPGRMWKRYLIGNATFVARAVAQATRLHAAVPIVAARASNFDRLRALAYRRVSSRLPDFTKRALDVFGSAAFGVALLPLLALTAIAIKLDSKGPVLFRQTRVGLNGAVFSMWKFRSMHVDAHVLHAQIQGVPRSRHEIRFKDVRDPRVTRVGRFIRKASIDELPQLWNVLVGEMSLVGPRPALPYEVANYTLADRDRLLVKPGITCTWQVSGRANIDFVGQVELDRGYALNNSVCGDVWLMLRTIPAVITARGAY